MFAFIFSRLSVIFTLLAASISHFLTAAMKFPCLSPNEIRLLCFESLFFCNPQITEGVNIKNNVEKDTTFLFFFSLSESPDGHAISFQTKPWIAFGCHTSWLSACGADGRAIGQTYGHVSTKIS